MNLFLVNLSIADFTMAGLGAPASLIAAALGVWPFGSTGCIVYAFGMSLAGNVEIYCHLSVYKTLPVKYIYMCSSVYIPIPVSVSGEVV